MLNINPVKYHTFLVLIITRLNSILIRSPETITPISKVNSVSTYTRIIRIYYFPEADGTSRFHPGVCDAPEGAYI